MPRRLWLALVATALVFASAQVSVLAQSAQTTTNDATATIGGISSISQATVNELAAAILQGCAAVGIDKTPAQALLDAAQLIARGDAADTLSLVTTVVTQGPPRRVLNLVRIVTFIGENAASTTRDHESAHKIINETLASGGMITDFLLAMLRDTGLGDGDLKSLMSQKLSDLDIEINVEWDALHARFRRLPHLELKYQKKIAEALAALKRDIFLALLERLMDDAVEARNGEKLSVTETFLLLRAVDQDITSFGSRIGSIEDLDNWVRFAQRDFPGLIEILLRGRGLPH